MIVIETPRFYLRQYTLGDVDALAEVLCDHDNMRFFPSRFERKDAEERVQKNLRRYAEDGVGQWPLFLKPEN
ncbi:MAG TPA: GNAT family N-acetyltransferase, partial [Bryobacteraceae bacterium]|nr:GNAT family N-acetyltransferase [Bryobacteraceae bacterium]